jgi:hypothetical protein
MIVAPNQNAAQAIFTGACCAKPVLQVFSRDSEEGFSPLDRHLLSVHGMP